MLDTQPSADVRVTVSRASGSPDVTWDADDQADGDQNVVTFTPQNWNTARTVTVRAAEDADQVNDNAVLRNRASSSDGGYNGLTASVNVRVDDDDDVPGIQLGVLRPSPVPEGGTARYTLRLNTQPAQDVTVTVSGDNADVTFDADDRTDGDQSAVTFTSQNWNAARTVTVRAATDPDAAPDEAVLTHTASSSDAGLPGRLRRARGAGGGGGDRGDHALRAVGVAGGGRAAARRTPWCSTRSRRRTWWSTSRAATTP